ncbi:C2 family cysteine protease [Arthrobacter sp. TMN-49]
MSLLDVQGVSEEADGVADFQGADVAELREFARELNKAAERLTQSNTVLSQHIGQGRGWQGPDAQRFRGQWSSRLRPTLIKVAAGLVTAGNELRVQAQEQETASADAGGSASVSAGEAGTGTDHSKPRYGDKGQADLSQGELDALKELTEKASDSNNVFLGNDKDVEKLREALEKLSPAELDQFLESLSDKDLHKLAEAIAGDGKGLFNAQGTTPFERQRLLDQLLSKASPEQVARIKEQFPWAQPNGVAHGDGAREGGASGDDSQQWMNPSGPVVGDNPSKNDIKQGGYGDCVVLAGAGALVVNDPQWVAEHVVDNGNGTVSVKLYDEDRKPQWVTVTDDVPANDKGTEKGARPGGNGNWPAYVEKALTQVYGEDIDQDGTNNDGVKDQVYGPGEYRAIEGNYGPDALKYLTGNDVSQTTDSTQLWEAVENGQSAIVTTQSKLPDGAPDGYIAGHAFTVEGMDADGNIVLQNPWGPERTKVTMTPKQFEDMFNDASVIAP